MGIFPKEQLGASSRRQVLGTALTTAASLAIPRWGRAQPAAKPIRIGVLNDQTSVYSAPGGPGSVVAARLAVQDVRGRILGRPVEILVGDHQNKPDVGAAIAREWLDSGVIAIADGGSSAVALAVQSLTRERKRLFLITGSTTTDLTGSACSPTGMQWMTDTYASANASIRAYLTQRPGTKRWFSLVADYTFGTDLDRYASAEISASGGTVVGRARFPLGTTDFGSVLLSAQASGAEAIAIGAGGADAVNAVKQAREFGLLSSMGVVVHTFYPTDLLALGPETAEGMIWVTSFYWDRDEASRQWTKRFLSSSNVIPTRIHAGTYSAVLNCLRAVEATDSDDGPTVAAKMKGTPLVDELFQGEHIRDDGRVMLPLFAMRSKGPKEIRYNNDIAEIVGTIPAEQAYRPVREGSCAFVK